MKEGIKKKILIILSIIALIETTMVIFIVCLTWLLISALSAPEVYQEVEDYERCMKEVVYKSSNLHFPKTIPSDAQEVKLSCNNDFMDGRVLLKFKTDKNYIESELKKNGLSVEDNKGQESIHSEIVGLQYEDMSYYPIDNAEKKEYGRQDYYNGIAVNKKTNEILYYIFVPD